MSDYLSLINKRVILHPASIFYTNPANTHFRDEVLTIQQEWLGSGQNGQTVRMITAALPDGRKLDLAAGHLRLVDDLSLLEHSFIGRHVIISPASKHNFGDLLPHLTRRVYKVFADEEDHYSNRYIMAENGPHFIQGPYNHFLAVRFIPSVRTYDPTVTIALCSFERSLSNPALN